MQVEKKKITRIDTEEGKPTFQKGHLYLEQVGVLPASNSAFDMSEDKIHARQGRTSKKEETMTERKLYKHMKSQEMKMAAKMPGE